MEVIMGGGGPRGPSAAELASQRRADEARAIQQQRRSEKERERQQRLSEEKRRVGLRQAKEGAKRIRRARKSTILTGPEGRTIDVGKTLLGE